MQIERLVSLFYESSSTSEAVPRGGATPDSNYLRCEESRDFYFVGVTIHPKLFQEGELKQTPCDHALCR